jgi:hypothetical protein
MPQPGIRIPALILRSPWHHLQQCSSASGYPLAQRSPYYHFCPYLRVCCWQRQIRANAIAAHREPKSTGHAPPEEASMKHFMIKYQFANGTPEEWHREIGRFIAALDNDPELKGKIIYRCMKNRDDSNYFHLATAADEQAVKTLQQRDFFKHYTEKTRQVAGGEVVVTPIEWINETSV